MLPLKVVIDRYENPDGLIYLSNDGLEFERPTEVY